MCRRGRDGTIIGEGNIDAFNMQLGDCFNDESDSDEVTSLPGVPCSEPHDNEVFAIFDLMFSEFPGQDKVSDLAFDKCLGYFQNFVGRDYESSSLDVFPITPTLSSWQQNNDKEVVCALYDLELNKLKGSVRGLGI